MVFSDIEDSQTPVTSLASDIWFMSLEYIFHISSSEVVIVKLYQAKMTWMTQTIIMTETVIQLTSTLSFMHQIILATRSKITPYYLPYFSPSSLALFSYPTICASNLPLSAINLTPSLIHRHKSQSSTQTRIASGSVISNPSGWT